MTSPRDWWKRLAAVFKDKRSIYLTMVFVPRSKLRNPDIEAAVIRATSHDDQSVDYKNAARVFTWARTSPAFVSPIMWAIARRAEGTRSWPVALKSLLLAHGLLLLNLETNSNLYCGRLPFDLSNFQDRYSLNPWGFSTFVRAYFQFLDSRAMLLSMNQLEYGSKDYNIVQVENLQTLLGLLMQIRPYADRMDFGVILDAMDCAVIEIFDVYSRICNGIASILVDVFGSKLDSKPKTLRGEEQRKRGMRAISILRKAGEQSAQLTNYFEVCRSLGVLNATELPPVERIPDEDIKDLERLVMHCDDDDVPLIEMNEDIIMFKQREDKVFDIEQDECFFSSLSQKNISVGAAMTGTVVTNEWVVFEDEFRTVQEYYSNPFLCSPSRNPFLCSPPDRHWATMMHNNVGTPLWNGNLIELM